MPGHESNWGSALTELRAAALQPFVGPKDTVLEHARPNYSTVVALEARRKIVLTPGTPLSAEVESAETFADLRDIDVVICDHVLEYMMDPRERLLQLEQILKPGGRLIAIALYDEAFRYPKQQKPAAHFYSWNVQTLGNLLVDCGYEFEAGAVKRWPKAERLAHWSAKVGPGAALFLTRLIAPEFEVRIVAKRPTA